MTEIRAADLAFTLEEAGALEYTTIVASPASDSAGFKYLAPYSGSSLGQHWMHQGQHVLIVFDEGPMRGDVADRHGRGCRTDRS